MESAARFRTDSLVLVSGGLDSTVLCYMLKARDGKKPAGLFFASGRPSMPRELASVNLLSVELNMPVQQIELDLGDPFSGVLANGTDDDFRCKPTRPENLTVGLGHSASRLAVAAFYAHAIEVDHVAVALVGEDTSRHPAIPEFLTRFSDALHVLQHDVPRIDFRAPFAKVPKSDVVRLGVELGVPLGRTWSCCKGGELHCGVCDGCAGRRHAFRDAGVEDETEYAHEAE